MLDDVSLTVPGTSRAPLVRLRDELEATLDDLCWARASLGHGSTVERLLDDVLERAVVRLASIADALAEAQS